MNDATEHSKDDSDPEIILDDLKEELSDSTIPKEVKKRHYISCIDKMYWFLYHRPKYMLMILPSLLDSIFNSFHSVPRLMVLSALSSEPDPIPQIKKASLLSVLITLSSGILSSIGHVLIQHVTQSIRGEIQRAFFKSLVKQDIEYFDMTSIGEINDILHNDVGSVVGAISFRTFLQYKQLFSLFSSVSLCFAISWQLTFFVIFVSILTFVFRDVFRSKAKEMMNVRRKEGGKTLTLENEIISNFRVISSYNQNIRSVNDVKKAEGKVSKAQSLVSTYFRASMQISQILKQFADIAMYSVGAWMIVRGDITAAQLIYIVGQTASLSMGLRIILSSNSDKQNARDASVHLFSIIDRIPTIPFDEGQELQNFSGRISFENVWFKYPSRDSWILKDISFEIEPRKSTALVGHSGSGKSTILQLILRFYDVNQGCIKFDGVDIKKLNPRWIHKVIGVVEQDPILFAMSVKNNILYGLSKEQMTEISDDDILRASDIALCSNFISQLPKTYDCLVGEKGCKLSGGQKQRIAIARSIIKDPKLMITDEATSALDSKSEKIVQLALDKALEGRTSIIIAHRLGTIKNANTIYMIESGRIVEQGSFQYLVDLHGQFYTLVQNQLISDPSKENIETNDNLELEL